MSVAGAHLEPPDARGGGGPMPAWECPCCSSEFARPGTCPDPQCEGVELWCAYCHGSGLVEGKCLCEDFE